MYHTSCREYAPRLATTKLLAQENKLHSQVEVSGSCGTIVLEDLPPVGEELLAAMLANVPVDVRLGASFSQGSGVIGW